jgi:outer membrane lipoprotein-sorting protein
LLLCLLVPAVSFAQDPLPSVDELVQHFDQLYRSSSSYAKMRMQISTADYQRELELELWTKGEDNALAVLRAPAKEAGTATLRSADGLWNYAPKADRLMRIPSGMLSEGWMGSHFSNDDLMSESSWVEDYDTQLERVEEGGEGLIRMTATPKKDAAVVYTKVLHFVTAKDWIPVRSEYYDDDALVRTLSYTGVTDFGDRKLPAVLELVPADKNNEYTRMEYTWLEFELEVDDALFTARGLRKVAK